MTTAWKRAALLMLAVVLAVPLFAGVADAKKKKSVPVKVMTRNLFLGADLTPAIDANSPQQFVKANGAILREVTETNFPLRAKGLADEISGKKPALVGMQEVALWRTGPPSFAPAVNDAPVATDVRYDFLKLLRGELKANGTPYKPAVVQDEFDFEAPADEDNDPQTGSSTFGGEINGRLTMRDVILIRKGSNVKLKNPSAGHFENELVLTISGVEVHVTRGWTAGDVTATKGKGENRRKVKFHFVNTHLEAFDDETEHPSIRAQQASELLAGPASAKRTILVGDLNSDDDTVKEDDQQAYRVLLDGGFAERSTADPLSCCVSDLFTSPPQQFDHQVDHVMTNMGKKAKLKSSSVTGLEQQHGIYDSDHAGIFSKLKLRK